MRKALYPVPAHNTFYAGSSVCPSPRQVIAQPFDITDHVANSDDPKEDVIITVMDAKGQGNAYYEYVVQWLMRYPDGRLGMDSMSIHFQNGPIKDNGRNGVTQEALLAIVAHRLSCFQEGEFACEENAQALYHINEALGSLKLRTERRKKQGVEGTSALD